ncbi:hybrid sensor histidine kinase/response regulator [Pseudomonas sp. MMS21-TM103]|uniref:hybrid sensor histidine kinase/response regulator n=1 Tax=Pseudomonas sp. MMS21 TM103 TaxID=2886506 RepID=UPI001EDCB7B3|nr:hybrid sensor histidine kinase/response regulator [Pseudomonas sp. MMS21 TM103]MCG4455208.1 hybrid sensor histidine kinase/response regulator [Pseudomonas sp. MMS21 TM103]
MNLEQEERLLLAQQRRGYRRLCFVPELEQGFVEHRVQRIGRRLLLIVSTAIVFQLIYTALDLLMMPLTVSLSVAPLRALGILGVLAAFVYCRRPQSPPRAVLFAYIGAYALNGACVAVIIHLCWVQGVDMPYDGLFLILLFGYVLLGVSFRAVSLAAWGFCLLFLMLGLLLVEPGSLWAYQGQFLICANLIGSVGAYLQEHGQRGAWLNLRLLDLARQRAEADDARKLRLLAAASHDLRQPLNAMGLYAQHLLEQSREPDIQRVSARLATSVEQLSRLLQSLLDYTRLTLPGGVQAKLEVFALRPLLERLSGETRREAELQGVELDLQCADLWVRSDPLLLERVLRNLLNNALCHAQAQRVTLSAEEDAGNVLLQVADDGRGLSQAEQAQIFEEFRQLDNPGRNAERGLGLGLAIVQQLARLLEHPLQLDSSPGQGARFSLRLPRATVGEWQPAKPVGAALHGRVLLVEDDEAGREALSGLLQRWGCEVWACADLQEALACLAEATPQLLVSDYRLGASEDGLRAIECLREAAGRMLPALLISADISPELQERCMPAHVTLLGKPLLPARLRQALAVLLPASEKAPRQSVGSE